jgi:hypothetical protein
MPQLVSIPNDPGVNILNAIDKFNTDIVTAINSIVIPSGGGLVSITYADLMTAIGGSTLIPGSFYVVTDRGDVALILQAVSANQLAVNGTRIMLCPRTYETTIDTFGNHWIGIWHAGLTPLNNQLAIWGGQVWQNVAGNVGTATDDVTLSADWTLIPKATFANNEYIQMVFGCQYDWTNDYVVKQWDNDGNVFVYNLDIDSFNNCDISDWNIKSIGTIMKSNSCRGIYNNITPEIYMNNNMGVIKNNIITDGITNNLNNGYISDNSNISEISYNSNASNINNNSNNGTIINNSNMGDIVSNSNNNSIDNNNNSGHISYNSNQGIIASNFNSGEISNNTNNGVIQYNNNIGNIDNNTFNVGDIMYNSNVGNISTNDNLGHIQYNKNNGNVENCSSGVITVHIQYNTNNGNISGVYAVDVTDPIVNK